MIITVFGSSHGVPEKNRKCTCLQVELGENRYFFDMGTAAIEKLRDIEADIGSVKGIFVSHYHGDHMNGLVSFVDLISWYKPFFVADPQILLPTQACIDALSVWRAAIGTPVRELRFGVIQDGLIYDDGLLRVTAIPTQHCPFSHAFLIEAEGKRVLYTGDLSASLADFPQAAVDAGLDLLICEGAHFSPVGYIPLLQGRAVGRVLWTHHAPRNMPDFPAFRDGIAPIPVEASYDGYTLTL